MKALAPELRHTAITNLNLNNNQICGAGARAPAPELRHPTITSLDLGHNQIGAAGAQALAPELRHTVITDLRLNHNPWFGDAGAQALAPELRHTAITTLDLEYARARSRVGSLAGALTRALLPLFLLRRGNYIGDAAKQAIRAALPDADVSV